MRRLLIAATALAMLGGVAYAQNTGSNSSSTATNSSGSQSTAVSNPNIHVSSGNSSSKSGASASASTRSSSRSAAVGNTTNVTVNSGGGTTGTGVIGGDTGAGTGTSTGTGTTSSSSSATVNTGGGGGDPSSTNVNYSGGYTVRNTPEVIPPNVMGGNPCAVGASGGISTPGFGLAMGATWADRACERRQQAALLFNMGEQKVALELMCQDDHIRDAMKVAARPCTADIPAPVSQAPAATAPVAQASVAMLIPVTTPAVAKPVPGRCGTACGAEARVVCTGKTRHRSIQGLCCTGVRQVTSEYA